ncbi:MAG: HlyD family type I secretion periplasmic adaptor subunit [Halioglobus sp.]|nr:HlyD family type I secretion periplasmic adaptor subunit [Halioglobus sp.]
MGATAEVQGRGDSGRQGLCRTPRLAWRDRAKTGSTDVDVCQRQFLPAALEVQDSPASPAHHWLLALLLSLFVLALLWACVGEVDIVVTAPGRVVPSGQVKRVQAPAAGTVAAILVAEGDRVEAGQALLRLDTTHADADDRRIREQIDNTLVQTAWRQALERWLAKGKAGEGAVQVFEAAPPSSLPRADQDRADALYRQYREEITARLLGLEKELAASRAERTTVRAERARVQATLAILEQRVGAYKALLDRQYGAKVQYLEMLQQQTELERTLPVMRSRERQLTETAAVISARIGLTVSEARQRNLTELDRLHSERQSLRQESRKATQHRQQQLLTAPVTGTVQELAIHTVGGVVSPAQELMKIVPEHATIEVEALLQNRDIGFVREGQVAAVKVDTFNFTKYGLIDAQVTNISDDAVEDQQLGWVFKMRLRLEQDAIAVENRLVRLSPGMAITAEVKTGRRRLIEFFLSPLLRYKQESVRER